MYTDEIDFTAPTPLDIYQAEEDAFWAKHKAAGRDTPAKVIGFYANDEISDADKVESVKDVSSI